ncbi:MAG: hypothetical protein ABIQ00_10380 [Chitinophagaceae bacterium]
MMIHEFYKYPIVEKQKSIRCYGHFLKRFENENQLCDVYRMFEFHVTVCYPSDNHEKVDIPTSVFHGTLPYIKELRIMQLKKSDIEFNLFQLNNASSLLELLNDPKCQSILALFQTNDEMNASEILTMVPYSRDEATTILYKLVEYKLLDISMSRYNVCFQLNKEFWIKFNDAIQHITS